jgi:hypothetical protein
MKCTFWHNSDQILEHIIYQRQKLILSATKCIKILIRFSLKHIDLFVSLYNSKWAIFQPNHDEKDLLFD